MEKHTVYKYNIRKQRNYPSRPVQILRQTDGGKSTEEIKSGIAGYMFLKTRMILTSKNMNVATKKRLMKTTSRVYNIQYYSVLYSAREFLRGKARVDGRSDDPVVRFPV